VKANRLAGHTMPQEGRVYDRIGRRVQDGPARCSCGATSEQVFTSVNARLRWHRDHKDRRRRRDRPTATQNEVR
jgi:hypothetical protein